MFTAEHREDVRRQLIERAQEDSRITSAALTGSAARKAEDRWSDIDLFFGVSGVIPGALDDWTAFIYGELGAIHHFVRQAIAGEDLVVHDDGTQSRAWCYIDDFVRGALLAMTKEVAAGRIYNIGDPRGSAAIPRHTAVLK